MSSSVVCQLLTEIRIAWRPCHVEPLIHATPLACTAFSAARVRSSDSKRKSTWLSTTSLSSSAPGSSAIPAAKRAAWSQQRSTSSAIPLRPSERIAA